MGRSTTQASGTWLAGRRATFQATLSLAAPDTVVVTLGACVSGCGGLRAGVGTTTFTWTPSNAATDLAGNAVTTAGVTQSGAPKRNF